MQAAVDPEKKKVLERKAALRSAVKNAERLDAAALKSLDASLKKVTPFLKKVKERLGEDTCANLIAEAKKLNLSKYIEEVASGVAEAKLRVSDILAAVDLCCTMHSLYADFLPALVPLLVRNATLLPPPATPAVRT